MSTSNRAPRHVWTNEEDSTLVECLMKLMSMGNGNRIMAITEMQGPAYSGFGWNDEEKYIIAEKELFDNSARVTGRFAETFVDVGSNEPGGYDGFDMGDGNEKFPPMTGSSGSKRKRGSQRKVDVEGIHLALDQTNEQLRMIAEWPVHALDNDNHVRTEFFRILREMPELTSLDKALCKDIFCLVWTTFGVSYSCLRMRERDFVESSPTRHHEIVYVCIDLGCFLFAYIFFSV
ncbi:retrotransposon protein [Cucumis melo var. makuwa]|uniref:Retrotransposon protein n=1 Tax=Cucumis melo var. makuwa TaxID=1194695 RepID=A0A5D3C4X5_CUCMM|nr:retrotransposon protein [Cucumis melo var. makuwa]